MTVSAINALSGNSQKREIKNELGQQDFLNLMVTQMKNQDPFNPMDSGEHLAQIAQFTTANGISELQKSFTQFQKDMSTDQALRSAALVGRDVLVEADSGYLGAEGSLSAVAEIPAKVENMTVSVYDSAGVLVREIPMGAQEAGQLDISWDGQYADGTRAAPGRYGISVTTELEGETYSLATLTAARVNSVTMSGNGQSPVLNLEGVGEISLASVRQIK